MSSTIRTILCTGDSHTWGQGAGGLEESFDLPVRAGDLRLAPFRFPCYVNLLRQRLNMLTGSSAAELDAAELTQLAGSERRTGCACIRGRPLLLQTDADLIRLQFLSSDIPSRARITVDGGQEWELNLRQPHPDGAYRTISIFCGPGERRRLRIAASEGSVLLYRAELYTGSIAVLNAGIGSCSTLRYTCEYWEDSVEKLHPSLVVLEAHTINDWLAGDPPAIYARRLSGMIKGLQESGCAVVLVTVSPILGPQSIPFSTVPYADYVEASRKAAVDCRIPLCDAHAVMSARLENLPEAAARDLLFHDNWHVNDLGHHLYADVIWDTLQESGLIDKIRK